MAANEVPGSLTLHSDHMNYGRAVLNSNWNQARESEPKDYDINKGPTRDLRKATYRRLATVTDGSFPETTYNHFSNQIHTKADFDEKMDQKMVDTKTEINLDRNVSAPLAEFGSNLPRHHPDHNKMHTDTTYVVDYSAPYEMKPMEEVKNDSPDYSPAYRRVLSQFTDWDGAKRDGRNTWADESGIYTNTHLKRQAPGYKTSDPFRLHSNEGPPAAFRPEFVTGMVSLAPGTTKEAAIVE